MGKLSVTGQKDQAGGIFIQTSDRKHILIQHRLREQFRNRRLTTVIHCSNVTVRFIHHVIKVFAIHDLFPVHAHHIGILRYFMIRRRLHFPVDGDTSGFNDPVKILPSKIQNII